jgi:hypothetical protein
MEEVSMSATPTTPDLAARLATAQQQVHETLAAARAEAELALGDVRQALAAHEAARNAAMHGPAPRHEILANLEQLLAAARARWDADHAHQVLRDLGGHFDVTERGRRVRRHPRLPHHFPDDRVRDELLHLVAAEVVYRRVAEAAGEHGVPMAEREERIARADARIAELERTEEEIIRGARAMGVHLARRPGPQSQLRDDVEQLKGRRDHLRGQVRVVERLVEDHQRRHEREQRAAELAELRRRLTAVERELGELEAVL